MAQPSTIHATIHRSATRRFTLSFDTFNWRVRQFVGGEATQREIDHIANHLEYALGHDQPLTDLPLYTQRDGHIISNDGWATFSYTRPSVG